MAHQDSFDHKEAQNQLRRFFAGMPRQTPLLLFSVPDVNAPFTDGIRKVVATIGEVTDQVTLQEYPLDHDFARQRGIIASPTLVFAVDPLDIRWLGAPLGHEIQTFMEALAIIGRGEPGLSEPAAKELAKLDEPRKIKVFVSPSCPYCPQAAVDAIRLAVARPELVSLEIIDIQANPELADRYEAHSVPQIFANDHLIYLGAPSQELLVASLVALEPRSYFIPDSDAEEIDCDLLIVGGGPAGLTAGIYANRSGLKTVVVEKGALGGQIAITPMVENYPGFTQVGGQTLVDILVSHALEYVDIFPGEEVQEIVRGNKFMITTNRRRYQARAVLLATGAAVRHLGVPGEQRLAGRGISYCSTCDGQLFIGKKVIIVGGGDSAVTDALHLHQIGVQVTLVHRRDKLRAQQRLITALEQSSITVMYNTTVVEILGKARVESVRLHDSATGEDFNMAVDGVFIAIGYSPAVDLAESLGAELTPDGYIKRDQGHRTTVPGLYSAGDVEGGPKQIVTAAGQGAEAALAIFEDLVNPYWVDQQSGD